MQRFCFFAGVAFSLSATNEVIVDPQLALAWSRFKIAARRIPRLGTLLKDIERRGEQAGIV